MFATVVNQHKEVNWRSKDVTQTEKQRLESPTVTLTWHASKYKVHKFHQRYILVSRFGLAVRRWAGKRKDLGWIPLRLPFLFKKVVLCGHCLVTLPITFYRNIKMALIAAHLNAGIILVVTV